MPKIDRSHVHNFFMAFADSMHRYGHSLVEAGFFFIRAATGLEAVCKKVLHELEQSDATQEDGEEASNEALDA